MVELETRTSFFPGNVLLLWTNSFKINLNLKKEKGFPWLLHEEYRFLKYSIFKPLSSELRDAALVYQSISFKKEAIRVTPLPWRPHIHHYSCWCDNICDKEQLKTRRAYLYFNSEQYTFFEILWVLKADHII